MGARCGPARRSGTRRSAAGAARGRREGGLPETAKRIGERIGGAEAGVAIDPRLFRLFGVERVPAVAVVPGGVPPCRSRGCARRPGAFPRSRDRKHRPRGGARSRRRRGSRRTGRCPPSSRTSAGRGPAMTERERAFPRPHRDRAGPGHAGGAAADLVRDVRAGLPDAVGGLRHGGQCRPRSGGPEGGGAGHRQCGQRGGARGRAGFRPTRPTCRAMRARTCRSGASARTRWRRRAAPGSPIRTIRAARPGGRWSGARPRGPPRAGRRQAIRWWCAPKGSRRRRSLRRTARTASPRAAPRPAARTSTMRETAGPAGPCATASAPAARR